MSIDSREHVKRWKHKGVECAIVSQPTHMNGYVKLPQSVDADYNDEMFDQIEVHGGLTYGVDSAGWIGFDTAHAGDHWPDEEINNGLSQGDLKERESLQAIGISSFFEGYESGRWSLDRLIKEVEGLARQVKSMP